MEGNWQVPHDKLMTRSGLRPHGVKFDCFVLAAIEMTESVFMQRRLDFIHVTEHEIILHLNSEHLYW